MKDTHGVSLTPKQIEAFEDLFCYCSLDHKLFRSEVGTFPLLPDTHTLDLVNEDNHFIIEFFFYSVPDNLYGTFMIEDFENKVKMILDGAVIRSFKYDQVEHLFESKEIEEKVNTMYSILAL